MTLPLQLAFKNRSLTSNAATCNDSHNLATSPRRRRPDFSYRPIISFTQSLEGEDCAMMSPMRVADIFVLHFHDEWKGI